MKGLIANFFKGIAMGAANVIPGVSGGTVALITGIFEPLIDSIKSFNGEALKLLLKGQFSAFAKHINLTFLLSVFLGIGVSIFSFAKILDYLFENFPIEVWSFFFGLILASVFFVARTIQQWKSSVWISFIIGATIAISISLMRPATENDSFIYLMICGIVAASSMILPGLSGSFVLILMGNYQLIMIDAVQDLNLAILLPVAVGAGLGILGFSHLLSWVFKKYKDQTIAILSGFILGSLLILWPWKEEIKQVFETKEKVIGYHWFLPEINADFWVAVLVFLIGIVSIYLMEKYSEK